MKTVNVHLVFLVNHTKLQRTLFIKQKYLTEITGTLLICKLIITSQTVIGKNVAKPLAKILYSFLKTVRVIIRLNSRYCFTIVDFR